MSSNTRVSVISFFVLSTLMTLLMQFGVSYTITLYAFVLVEVTYLISVSGEILASLNLHI